MAMEKKTTISIPKMSQICCVGEAALLGELSVRKFCIKNNQLNFMNKFNVIVWIFMIIVHLVLKEKNCQQFNYDLGIIF